MEDGSIQYLTEEDLIYINRRLIETQTPNEPIYVINPENLSASVYRPATYRYYEQTDDMFQLAAVLIDSLVKNHCFANGNKRTAMQAGAMFLLLNGYELMAIDPYEYAHMAEGIAMEKYDLTYLESWLFYNSKTFNTLYFC